MIKVDRAAKSTDFTVALLDGPSFDVIIVSAYCLFMVADCLYICSVVNVGQSKFSALVVAVAGALLLSIMLDKISTIVQCR